MNSGEPLLLFQAKNIDGHYLTGVAVVFARDEGHARELLCAELASAGLPQQEPERISITPIDNTRAGAVILFDGNY